MSKVLLGFLVLAGIMGFWGVSSYNKLVSLDQAVQAQWSQVENVYQRRADLVPNLVETVKGAAKFEKDTFTAVTEARAKVGQVQGNTSPNDPASVNKFRDAQDQLSSALSKLLVVVERYPDLKATQAFRDLQVQLEGDGEPHRGRADAFHAGGAGVQQRAQHVPAEHHRQRVRQPVRGEGLLQGAGGRRDRAPRPVLDV